MERLAVWHDVTPAVRHKAIVITTAATERIRPRESVVLLGLRVSCVLEVSAPMRTSATSLRRRSRRRAT